MRQMAGLMCVADVAGGGSAVVALVMRNVWAGAAVLALLTVVRLAPYWERARLDRLAARASDATWARIRQVHDLDRGGSA